MRIRRISAQSKSLTDFYQDFADPDKDYPSRNFAEGMLCLLDALAKEPGDDYWGVTSHLTLGLHEVDDYLSRCLVDISCVGGNQYNISYRLPDRIAPWPEARVTGITRTVEEAVRMIGIGLQESIK